MARSGSYRGPYTVKNEGRSRQFGEMSLHGAKQFPCEFGGGVGQNGVKIGLPFGRKCAAPDATHGTGEPNNQSQVLDFPAKLEQIDCFDGKRSI
jgi:hypothetical protein